MQVATFWFRGKYTFNGKMRIIIPTSSFNSPHLVRCLSAINSAKKPRSLRVEVVVSKGKDFNFSNSINSGLKEIDGEDILLLNDDCFIDKNTLKEFISSKRDGDGVLGGVLRFPNGGIQHYGGYISTNKFRSLLLDSLNKAPLYSLRFMKSLREDRIRFLRPYHYTRKVRKPPDFVTGALLFIPNYAYNVIGKFDNRFVNGFEDIDYCYRARKAGYGVRVIPNATGIHIASASLSKVVDRKAKENTRRFVDLWLSNRRSGRI